ncbi:MAG: MAE_28990/MAE_18760 family HEPN-like nuclease [Phormidium sp.]
MLIETIEISLRQVRQKTQAIRFILNQNRSLRNILFTNDEEVRQKASELKLNLSENSISIAEWEIYEHSAVVTQLYSTYENFVKKLISKWLEALPLLVTKYDHLDEVIRKNHKNGVCELIPKLEDDRYKHLKLEQIVQGLFYGIIKNSKYELIPECFLIKFQNNLRQSELQSLLSAVGLNDNSNFGWKWLENHQNIKEYIDITLSLGGSNQLKNELDQFIENRNIIAHSLVKENEFLGYNSLLNLCSFVEAICEALADLLIYHFLLKKTKINQAKEIGKIQNFLSNKQVIKATVNSVTLSIGDKIFIVNPNSSYCKAAIIQELRNKNDQSKQTLRIRNPQDISLKINMTNAIKSPKKNQLIYILNLT